MTFPLHELLQTSGTVGGEEEEILERAFWAARRSLNKEFVVGLM